MEIPLILVLIFFSFIFSGSEVALFSVSRTHLKKIKDKKTEKVLNSLISHPYTLLSTILLGNTAVNAFASSIFSIFIADLFQKYQMSEGSLTVIDVAVFTFILLIFGEITPKILALQNPLRFSSLSWVVLYPFYILLSPVVRPLGKWMRGIFEADKKKTFEPVTLKEAYNMVETARTVLNTHELELLENSVEFLSIKVSDIMTPRKDIKALPEEATIHDAIEEMRKTRHSRFPVYKGNLDNIIGFLDLLNIQGIHKIPRKTPIREYLLDPIVVPETMSLPDLVKILVETEVKMAVVVDEYGGTEGIVTLKDTYKHFIGKIRSDFESDELEEIKKIGANSFILSGDVSMSTVEKITGRRFGYYGTISNFIIDNLGYIPTEGEKAEIDGLIIEILSKEGESPEKVKITIK